MRGFIEFTTPDYLFGWLNLDVCARLDAFLAAVRRRESPRLMLFAPPRHGKSEIVSRKFPAYALGRYPDLSIMATSYGADLSSRINRDVQRLIDEPGYQTLFPETWLAGTPGRSSPGTWARNNDIFEVVGHKGSYRSAGVGGGITGMGGEILLIDDPIKDAKEASSAVTRELIWDWYRQTFYTRRAPGAGIALIATRWHIDDLPGRLIDAMANAGEQWEIVSYPAIAEHDEPHRRAGEPLHPERYDLEALQATRTALGSYAWQALYQQRPIAREGGMFKRRWFEVVAAAPAVSYQIVRSWDLAATEAGGDYTVGVRMSRDQNGVFYVEHVERLQGSAFEVERTIMNYATSDGRGVTIRLPQDAGQAGKSQVKSYAALLAGWNLSIERETGSKEVRAASFAAQCEAGNVKLVAGPWHQAFFDEIANFPLSPHDDQVDAAVGAFTVLVDTPAMVISAEALRNAATPPPGRRFRR